MQMIHSMTSGCPSTSYRFATIFSWPVQLHHFLYLYIHSQGGHVPGSCRRHCRLGRGQQRRLLLRLLHPPAAQCPIHPCHLRRHRHGQPRRCRLLPPCPPLHFFIAKFIFPTATGGASGGDEKTGQRLRSLRPA